MVAKSSAAASLTVGRDICVPRSASASVPPSSDIRGRCPSAPSAAGSSMRASRCSLRPAARRTTRSIAPGARCQRRRRPPRTDAPADDRAPPARRPTRGRSAGEAGCQVSSKARRGHRHPARRVSGGRRGRAEPRRRRHGHVRLSRRTRLRGTAPGSLLRRQPPRRCRSRSPRSRRPRRRRSEQATWPKSPSSRSAKPRSPSPRPRVVVLTDTPRATTVTQRSEATESPTRAVPRAARRGRGRPLTRSACSRRPDPAPPARISLLRGRHRMSRRRAVTGTYRRRRRPATLAQPAHDLRLPIAPSAGAASRLRPRRRAHDPHSASRPLQPRATTPMPRTKDKDKDKDKDDDDDAAARRDD